MRNTLLVTVAAAALVAGTVMVSAQGMGGAGGAGPGGAGGAGSPPSVAPPPSSAPAEKMDKSGPGPGQRAQQPDRGTTGQGTGSQMDRGTGGPAQMDRDGPTQQPRTGQEQDRGRGQMERGQTQPQMDRGQAQEPRAGQGGTKQQTGQGQGSTATSLNTEQRTKIRETVLRGGNVNRVTNVNFTINVGTVVPRSVTLVAVPSTIVEIHPAWRGYLYFVVGDEIIIVEPGTLRIVAVIT
jgi:hypothetical protein